MDHVEVADLGQDLLLAIPGHLPGIDRDLGVAEKPELLQAAPHDVDGEGAESRRALRGFADRCMSGDQVSWVWMTLMTRQARP